MSTSASFARRGRARSLVAVAVLCLLSVVTTPAAATTAFGLTTDNQIVAFDTALPATPIGAVAITGLQPGESALAIDLRPATGQIYLLGSTSRLYRVNPITGVAVAVGGPFTPALSGTTFGFDFNPVVDRIRVVSDTGQNLRLHPETGAVAAVDTPLNPGPPPSCRLGLREQRRRQWIHGALRDRRGGRSARRAEPTERRRADRCEAARRRYER